MSEQWGPFTLLQRLDEGEVYSTSAELWEAVLFEKTTEEGCVNIPPGKPFLCKRYYPWDREVHDDFRVILQRSWRRMRGVDHASLASVYGVGEIKGQGFCAMPLLRGRSIESWVHNASGSVALERASSIFLQICSALDCACSTASMRQLAQDPQWPQGALALYPRMIPFETTSSHRVYRRSILPHHILVDDQDNAKLLGLGFPGSPVSLTRTGAAIRRGFWVLSPESLESRVEEGKAWIYALAMMFYRLTTVNKAFEQPFMTWVANVLMDKLSLPPGEHWPEDLAVRWSQWTHRDTRQRLADAGLLWESLLDWKHSDGFAKDQSPEDVFAQVRGCIYEGNHKGLIKWVDVRPELFAQRPLGHYIWEHVGEGLVDSLCRHGLSHRLLWKLSWLLPQAFAQLGSILLDTSMRPEARAFAMRVLQRHAYGSLTVRSSVRASNINTPSVHCEHARTILAHPCLEEDLWLKGIQHNTAQFMSAVDARASKPEKPQIAEETPTSFARRISERLRNFWSR